VESSLRLGREEGKRRVEIGVQTFVSLHPKNIKLRTDYPPTKMPVDGKEEQAKA
jgi:hypothetical protein